MNTREVIAILYQEQNYELFTDILEGEVKLTVYASTGTWDSMEKMSAGVKASTVQELRFV